jgi:broad specificity phosphatase PhoE
MWEEARSDGRLVLALIRHGRTAWNVERRFLGVTDLPLDAVGEAQAEALGRTLPLRFDRVWSSPLSRALATARRLDPTPTVHAGLAEMSQGCLEGLSRDEAVAKYPEFFEQWVADPVDVRIPGGETLTECASRGLAAVRHVADLHRAGEIVAVVTHQLVIASVTCAAGGAPLSRWREHGIENCAITLLAWDGERFDVLGRGWRHPEVAAAGSDRGTV